MCHRRRPDHRLDEIIAMINRAIRIKKYTQLLHHAYQVRPCPMPPTVVSRPVFGARMRPIFRPTLRDWENAILEEKMHGFRWFRPNS